jgi:hypothetical protein
MQRESPRALVLNPSGEISGAHAPPGIFVLDKAFVLIEGHPPFFPTAGGAGFQNLMPANR